MMTAVSKLGYIGLDVRDVDAWSRFATTILGLERSEDSEDGVGYFRMDEMHHRLAVRRGEGDDIAYAGWEVDTDAALEATAARLVSRGFEIEWGTDEHASRRRVARLFTVRDPEGLDNEVYRGLREAGPFTSPRDLGGFCTGDLGVGHIVLFVEDVAASTRFYVDGLGLRLSDTIDIDMGPAGVRRATFLHAGPRHHALALLPIDAPRRLHHLMLELVDLDDVGRAYDRCRERAVPIALELGRHTNDRMTSFYAASPAGFQVEIGQGGVWIDDDAWEVRHYDAPSLWGHRPPPAGQPHLR